MTAKFCVTEKNTIEMRKQVSYYSTDEQILKKMLTAEDVIDWSSYLIFGGMFLGTVENVFLSP